MGEWGLSQLISSSRFLGRPFISPNSALSYLLSPANGLNIAGARSNVSEFFGAAQTRLTRSFGRRHFARFAIRIAGRHPKVLLCITVRNVADERADESFIFRNFPILDVTANQVAD